MNGVNGDHCVNRDEEVGKNSVNTTKSDVEFAEYTKQNGIPKNQQSVR